MSINTAVSKHPSWEHYEPDWRLMRDAYAGERVVKAMGATYLYPTPGMVNEGYPSADTDGARLYDAYIKRAVFPDNVTTGVDTLVGLMHRKPAVITVPDAAEPWLESLTVDGQDVQALLRWINTQQLQTGRLGMLVDVPTGASVAGAVPYVSTYEELHVINWDVARGPDGKDMTSLVVLNESSWELNESDLSWDYVEQYKVLALAGVRPAPEIQGVEDGTYVVFTVTEQTTDWRTTEAAVPQLGGQTLDRIPFVFCNAMDVVPDPDQPPLLGLGNRCMAIYRGEADYRQSLFLQGQETLVIIGSDDDRSVTVGAHAVLHVPLGGDSKYVGVSADGLEEQRLALENDGKIAAELGSRLLGSADEGGRASGESLRVRVSARTPTLTGMAKTGALALQDVLQLMVGWSGGRVEDVQVEPNLDFVQDVSGAEEIGKLQTAKVQGAPISSETIHEQMRRFDITRMEYEDELAAIESEPPALPGPGDLPEAGGA